MRAALVVCLLLTLEALLDASATKRKKLSERPRRPRKTIWSSIRRNAADVRQLTRALNETKPFGQEIGPIVDTLKDNVDNMKEGFASQTMMIRKLTRATNETEQSQQVIDTLKDNVDDMKKDFASMTLMMAQMQTSINDMKDAIENLKKITSEGEICLIL